MAYDSYEDAKSLETEALEEEKANAAPPLKKQRLCDSMSDANDDNAAASEDDNSASVLKKQCVSDSASDARLSDDKAGGSKDEDEDEDEYKASAAEDENPAPLVKKQGFNESATDAPNSGNSISTPEEEIEFNFVYELESDSECEVCYETDIELLKLGRVNYRAVDKWNLPEVYAVFPDGEEPLVEAQCFKLLHKIGCRDRYIGCSVEVRAFFAKLNKDEAARILDAGGVRQVRRFRDCVYDI